MPVYMTQRDRDLGALAHNEDGTTRCKRFGCDGELRWFDEIVAGSNGALSDQGTDEMIALCEKCGGDAV